MPWFNILYERTKGVLGIYILRPAADTYIQVYKCVDRHRPPVEFFQYDGPDK
jgi:hypothetical protein